MENWISFREAVNIASRYPATLKIPRTVAGILYVAKKYKFLKIEKGKYDKYGKPFVDKKKLIHFFEYAKKPSLSGISKQVGIHVTIIRLYLYDLNIRGERIYGQTFLKEKDSQKVINYCQDKKRNKKRTRKKNK
ncbi:MAG: hypothetical protein ACFFDN_02050 [Candidatus Hodarchaeota archaeon]